MEKSMRKEQTKKKPPVCVVAETTPVVQNDWISLLPDDILHCILRRLLTPQQAAQTSALSRRWQSLWQSYPVVEFDCKGCNGHQSDTANLESFVSATIRRFSRDSLQRVEKMDLYVSGRNLTLLPLVVQLLNLASNRKAQEVCIVPSSRHSGYLRLPLELLSNSSLRSLMLGHVALYRSLDLSNLKLTDKDCCECDDDLLSLNSLRSLHLWKVVITDERVLTDLFRSSPLLETLKLGRIPGMKKIRVSEFAKLRTLTISASAGYSFGLPRVKEIEIVAPGLETLHLYDIPYVSRIDVTAPRLSHLEIDKHELSFGYIAAMISSNFPYLETLKLGTITGMKKIRVSKVAKLRTLTMSCFSCSLNPDDQVEVEEIEIVAPGLETLHLRGIRKVSRIDVTAPQLSHLEIDNHDLGFGYITAMISSNFPYLETLKLTTMTGMKKILVSKVAKLRTLTISCFGYSYDPDVVKVEEIEIVAPGLETLHLDDIRTVSRIDVTAPQLSHLEIGYYHDLSLGYIAAMISTNFPSLKSLKLYTYAYEWKLLRGSELVKFLLLPELYH